MKRIPDFLSLAGFLVVLAFITMRLDSSFGASPPGTVLFQTDFESEKALSGLVGKVQVGPGHESPRGIYFVVPSDAKSRFASVQIPLPIEKMRGCMIHAS